MIRLIPRAEEQDGQAKMGVEAVPAVWGAQAVAAWLVVLVALAVPVALEGPEALEALAEPWGTWATLQTFISIARAETAASVVKGALGAQGGLAARAVAE